MATPPKSPAQPAKYAAPPPVPSQGIPSRPIPEPTTTFNIHGVPQGPQPNMAPEADISRVDDVTRAEMDAGRVALQNYNGRTRAEMEYGKKMVERKSGGAPPSSDVSPSKSD